MLILLSYVALCPFSKKCLAKLHFSGCTFCILYVLFQNYVVCAMYTTLYYEHSNFQIPDLLIGIVFLVEYIYEEGKFS